MPSNASEQLHAIAAALKARGERGVKRELTAGLRLGAQPLVSAVRGAAAVSLPRRGGLNEWEADQRITVSVLTGSPRTAGVALRTRTRGSMQTDNGYVRHRYFGTWYPNAPSQQIPEAIGWWSKTLERESPAIRPLLVAVIEKVSGEIQAAGDL